MSHRLESWLSWFFFAIGFGLLAVVAYWQFAPAPGLAIEAEETDIEVSGCVPGQTRDVALRLRNTSSRPARILGFGVC